MAPFSKPETVLKQAEGLISVGQTQAALQSLNEMFNSKRFRSTPISALEPIMLRFIELCVDLRKGRFAKEGLMQYKNITQNTSVQSIEVVIHAFIAQASEKVAQAQVKATQAVELADLDDLEASESPEDILLSAVSGDQSKDRTDRALVTPWLKFLWETYRSALETLKNNARLEGIYQQTALQAFKFCLKHNRKVEFRRLCETLRLHLANVAKYSHQAHSINLSDPDTLQRFLDTRFAQLNTSVELELWQEAFRSIEDIHSLLTMAKRPPKPTMMVNYYEKLYKIFMTSGSSLYHAAAWSKYYAIVRTTSTKSEEELAQYAGMVLLSALAVPTVTELAEDGDETKGKHARLTTLLGLGKTPTRTSLLHEALSRNVLKVSAQPIQRLYQILEVDFDPLDLCAHAAPILKALSEQPDSAPYLPHLRRVILSRLLSQLAQAYSSLTISHLLSLVAPLNEGLPDDHPSRFDQENIEAFIMSTAKRGELLVRINHSEGSLTFVDDAFSTKAATPINQLQPSPATLVRTRLTTLAQTLYNTLEIVAPTPKPPKPEVQLKTALDAAKAERAALQLRRSIVARRRELLAELTARKQSAERSQQAEAARRAQEEAAKKKVDDALRETRERMKADLDKRKREESEKILSSLKDKGVSVNLDEMDTDKLVKLQVEQMDREKRGLTERMRIVAKRIDHTERAFRKAELPLLADDYERQQKDDRIAWETTAYQTVEAAQQLHQDRLNTKKRLTRMLEDQRRYVRELEKNREQDYQKRCALAEKKIAEEKAKRRAAVLKAREEEAQARAEQDRLRREAEDAKEQEERRRAEEEARRRAEEEAKREAEEMARREAEEQAAALRRRREEERAAAAEQARLQRQRQEDAERRLKERLARPAPAPAQPASTWRQAPPARAEPPARTPVAAPASGGPARYIPPSQRVAASASGDGGGSGGSGGGSPRPPWGDRERERVSSTAGRSSPAPPRSSTPAAPATPTADDDGFQTVAPRQKPPTGAYRPPGRR